MKILICADIHGNYQALQTLLKTKCAKTCDKIYVLGDMICMGPQPNEVIETIKNNPKICAIMGNHDKWVSVEPPPSSVNYKKVKIKHHDYMRSIITDENLEYLKSLPYYKTLRHGEYTFYFTHYGWKEDFIEVIDHPNEIESQENIDTIFPDIKADCIFFGHNHDSLEFMHNNKIFICVGTLGMSRYGTYIVLTLNEDGSYIIERKILRLQIYKTLRLMRQLKYPRYNLYSGYLLGKYSSIYTEEFNCDKVIDKPIKLIFKSPKK